MNHQVKPKAILEGTMEESCRNCEHKLCARRVPIFSNLEEHELQQVVALIRRKRYQKGENLLFEWGELQGLVIINQGKAKAYSNTLEGKEQILHIFYPGDFFGEKNLFVDKKTAYSVKAIEPVAICMISKKDFQSLIRKYPGITSKILEALVIKIENLENMIENMGSKSVDARMSKVLLDFMERSLDIEKVENTEIFNLPLSREELANYIGVSRETVSRKLTGLQDLGIIRLIGNKKIQILDENKLRELS
jgi:CRP/FNR family transcriptional regulator